MESELLKRKELRKTIFNLCTNIIQYHSLYHTVERKLKEKVWIQTERCGYEFAACKVWCRRIVGLDCIEIVNEDGGIHCSAYLLNSRQLEEIIKAL